MMSCCWGMGAGEIMPAWPGPMHAVLYVLLAACTVAVPAYAPAPPQHPLPCRMVYLGPSHLALPYFESLGFALPHNENPADFCLDVVSGR